MVGSLPRATEAEVDPAKFIDYSMDPENLGNQGKGIAFSAVGYDVSTREGRSKAFLDLLPQIQAALTDNLADGPIISPYGERYRVRIKIVGCNQRGGTLVNLWQIDQGSEIPRLISNWLEVHSL